jgi:large subunit ribosomal protein L35
LFRQKNNINNDKSRGDLMPKLKTHRGAAKRFSLTATGKVKRSKAFASHILTKKTTKRKRALRRSTLVDSANLREIKRLIPYL